MYEATCGRREASPKGYRFAYALVQALCYIKRAVTTCLIFCIF